jgi:hypothetical protein
MSVAALLAGESAPLQSQHRSSTTFSKPGPASAAASYLAGGPEPRTRGESVPDKWFTPSPVDSARPRSVSTLRYAAIGAVVGGVIGAVWIGNEASHGHPGNEAAMSPESARTLGAVVGMVTGAGIGTLVAWIRRTEVSSAIRRRGPNLAAPSE